ncbi:hypothetical protein MHU86_3119 [Fragilaria crotonensis]|nr:hypothetical protein MHU86_3119 [Fragilaria crotonensis]
MSDTKSNRHAGDASASDLFTHAENFPVSNSARPSFLNHDGPVSTNYGRKKAPPTCDPSLKKEGKTTEELSKYAFAPGFSITPVFDEEESAPVAFPVSSASSACSTENGGELSATPADKQRKINKSMLLRTESRQGRESQRWTTEADTHQRVRLVTGCVPILTGGRILFVSASRKPEWILPKGGWEQDETMQESAIREAYEEAGVLGTLGPALAPVQYETRKSKKRRSEMAELLRKCNTFEDVAPEEAKDPLHSTATHSVEAIQDTQILSDAVVNRIREAKPNIRCDETSSNASDSSSYSLVKLTMFPLYVSEIKDSWPECGRFRKIVHIDEAIEMLEAREELRAALIQVKERNLHLMSESPATVVQKD